MWLLLDLRLVGSYMDIAILSRLVFLDGGGVARWSRHLSLINFPALSRGFHDIPRPGYIHNLSSMLWVFSRGSNQLDMHRNRNLQWKAPQYP